MYFRITYRGCRYVLFYVGVRVARRLSEANRPSAFESGRFPPAALISIFSHVVSHLYVRRWSVSFNSRFFSICLVDEGDQLLRFKRFGEWVPMGYITCYVLTCYVLVKLFASQSGQRATCNCPRRSFYRYIRLMVWFCEIVRLLFFLMCY